VDAPAIRLLRFADLKAAKVVSSWPQLKRLIDNYGFPAGYHTSPSVRVWDVKAVEDWLQHRREAAIAGQAQCERGRRARGRHGC
jgi:hypothetical protein